jgi:hypothetical protein
MKYFSPFACDEYYISPTKYSFGSFDGMVLFLENFLKSNPSRMSNTFLSELINTKTTSGEFDFKKLPKIINGIFNFRLKTTHLLKLIVHTPIYNQIVEIFLKYQIILYLF